MKTKNAPKMLSGLCKTCGKKTDSSAGAFYCSKHWDKFKQCNGYFIGEYQLIRVDRSANSESYIVKHDFAWWQLCAFVTAKMKSRELWLKVTLFSDLRDTTVAGELPFDDSFCAVLEQITQGWKVKTAYFETNLDDSKMQNFKAKVWEHDADEVVSILRKKAEVTNEIKR